MQFSLSNLSVEFSDSHISSGKAKYVQTASLSLRYQSSDVRIHLTGESVNPRGHSIEILGNKGKIKLLRRYPYGFLDFEIFENGNERVATQVVTRTGNAFQEQGHGLFLENMQKYASFALFEDFYSRIKGEGTPFLPLVNDAVEIQYFIDRILS
jgi:hypothetical protein